MSFIKEKTWYTQFNIDELLSFESSKKEIDGVMKTIYYKNGAEAWKQIIAGFKKAVKF